MNEFGEVRLDIARAHGLDEGAVRWYEVLQALRMLDEVARWRRRGVVTDSSHPFETMASGLVRHVAAITGVTVALPATLPSDVGTN